MSLKQSKEEQQLRNAIDRLEDAYEFMIAYAAQGRRLETNDDGPSKIRAAISAFLISIQEIEATGLTKINEDAKVTIVLQKMLWQLLQFYSNAFQVTLCT